MTQPHRYPIPASLAERTLVSAEQYRKLYQQFINDPDSSWREYV